MAKVIVHQGDSGKAAVTNPFVWKVEEALEAVRKRAFELFEARGCQPGNDLEDWLRAEKELFDVAEAEVAETNDAYTITIAVPGFETADIEVIALPREILVEATQCQQGKCLYRRFELTGPIDTGAVRAKADRGRLTIAAPKKMIQTIPDRDAAA